MLSGAIAYQVLQQENPPTIEKIKEVLKKHPWYSKRWQARLQDFRLPNHGLVLFMQAARWADDIQSGGRRWSLKALRNSRMQLKVISSRPSTHALRYI
jgi:hypothetical protein